MSIGANIRRARKALKLTQTELGNRIGHGSGVYISRIERNHISSPTARVLIRIARELGCTLDYLLSDHLEGESENEAA